jgi:putative spermidine/putrescine transport system permease protein
MTRAILWNRALGVFVGLACLYLVLPTVAIVPISFSDTDFIIFPPKGFSLRWYRAFFEQEAWRAATANSLAIAIAAAATATVLGTAAAFALRRFSGRSARLLTWTLLLPMLIPSIITAVAFYRSFAALGLVGTRLGLVLAHTLLALPFVIINVSAVMQKIDWRIVDAARSLGASPLAAFLRVTLPAIAPGVLAGATFAFLTSFDEVVVAIFLSGVDSTTLPAQMWSGIRFELSPIIAAAATLLFAASVIVLAFVHLLQRRMDGPR